MTKILQFPSLARCDSIRLRCATLQCITVCYISPLTHIAHKSSLVLEHAMPNSAPSLCLSAISKQKQKHHSFAEWMLWPVINFALLLLPHRLHHRLCETMMHSGNTLFVSYTPHRGVPTNGDNISSWWMGRNFQSKEIYNHLFTATFTYWNTWNGIMVILFCVIITSPRLNNKEN